MSRLKGRAPLWRHHIETGAARLLAPFVRRLGPKRAGDMAGALARWIGPLTPLDARAREGLALIWPELPAGRALEIRKGMYDHFARIMMEYPQLDRLAQDARLEIDGAEHISAARAAGRGIVLASGHFGNWEALRLAMGQLDAPCALIYRAFNNPLFDAYAQEVLAPIGAPVFQKGRRGALGFLRHIKSGGAGLILLDQRFTGAPTLDFLGAPALTALSAAEIALSADAALIPAYAARIGRECRFQVAFEAPVAPPKGLEGEAAARAMTQSVNDAMGRWITARPEQWFWLHRRWRGATLPPRDGSV